MKIALFLLSLLAVAAARKNARIHHGRVISQRELELIYPFVVSIKACFRKGCKVCTGSLVSRDTVLTAAHCVCKSRRIHVYFNSTKMFRGTKISVRSMRINENYRCGVRTSQFQYDIATLKLSQPKTDIKPIRLDCRNDRLGEPFTIIGFGIDERKKFGTLKIGHQRTVRCPNKTTGVICSNVYLVFRDRIDRGDSGGPMLVWWGFGFKQLGIQVGGIRKTWSRSGKKLKTLRLQTYNPVKPYCQWILK